MRSASRISCPAAATARAAGQMWRSWRCTGNLSRARRGGPAGCKGLSRILREDFNGDRIGVLQLVRADQMLHCNDLDHTPRHARAYAPEYPATDARGEFLAVQVARPGLAVANVDGHTLEHGLGNYEQRRRASGIQVLLQRGWLRDVDIQGAREKLETEELL